MSRTNLEPDPGAGDGSSFREWLTRPVSRRSILGSGVLGTLLGRLIQTEERTRWVSVQLPDAGSTLIQGSARGRRILRLHAVGDIGLESEARDFMVREMTERMSDRRADAVLLLGDNFYPAGVSSTDDVQWRTKFEQLFPTEDFPIPFYACLGNHDHKGNMSAQVDYTRLSGRWRMPDTHYGFSEDLGSGSEAQFFVLDTERIWKDHSPDTRQLVWLESELSRSSARWKIVVGHHPIRSGGVHGPQNEVASRIEPLIERHGVDLYVSGHDHDMQLLQTDAGWFHLVSGAGSVPRDTRWTRESLFVEAKPGFASLAIGPEELRIEFFAANEGLIHAHTIRKDAGATSEDLRSPESG